MNQWFVRQILLFLFIFVFTFGAVDAALARSVLQSAQEVKPSKPPTQGEQDIRALEVGKPIERELKGAQIHVYGLTLTAGQLLHIIVDQRGIDVVVTLFGPDRKQVLEVDSPNGIQGPEPVWAIAEISGTYRLEVRSLEKDAKPGRYEVNINQLRDATEQDKNHVAAERAVIEAELLLAQGTAESLRRSIEKYEESLPFSRNAKDRAGEATTLNNIGGIYHSLGEKQKALDYFNQALPISRAAGDSSGEARTLNNIGSIYNSLGDKQKALEYYDQALPILRKVKDRFGEAATLNNIGALYHSLGEKQKALEYFNQALPIMREAGDPSGEARALGNIGVVYNSLGEKQKALEYYDQALPISRAAGDLAWEATILGNIGAVYDDLGDKQKALEYYNQALPITRAAGDRAGEAATLNNIGLVYNSLGDKQKALEYYSKALPFKRAAEDPYGEAATLNNIGRVYDSLGDKQKALDYFNKALPIRQAVGDRSGEAATLNNIGIVHFSLGDKQKALEYFNQTLSISRAVRDRSGEATTLNNIGGVYDDLGQKQRALDYYEQSLLITREVGDQSVEASTLNNIGRVYDDLGDKQKALGYYSQALPILRKVGNRSGEATTLNNIGGVYASLDDKQKALDYYQEAITTLEDIRSAATIEEIKIGLAEGATSAYLRASLLLMSLQQHSKAFNLTERARSRTFLDQLGNISPNSRKSTDDHLFQQEQISRLFLVSLETRLRQEKSNPFPSQNGILISSIETQLAVKRREYEDLLIRLKLTNPEYASLRSVNTLTLPEVQKTLNKDTTLLSYFVTPEKTLAFVITRDSFRAVELPVKETDLRQSINWFRSFASLRNPQPESLKQLYSWLIAPLKRYVKTPVVGIIPHGVLHYLPFAALTDGKSYFGDEHTIFYLPSASVLPFIEKKSKPVRDRVLTIAQSQAEGFSALKYADEEVRLVAHLYNTEPLTTGSASKLDFLKRAGNYSIIHIAAHAELNTTSPLFSRIMLGGDKDDTGALEVREVYELDLTKASLVVLSACETQLGAHSKGDDIVGLNRAFIYAGTPTVIASLWTVDDKSTSYLMKAFYTYLKRGMSKAEALRAAQSDIRKKYPHPYYWSAFVLTGDPRQTTQYKPGRKR